MKKIIILLLLTVGCKNREPYDQNKYTVSQRVYSAQGVDSVETSAYWYKNSTFVGHGIYQKKNTLDKKRSDSIEASRFIETHKKNR